VPGGEEEVARPCRQAGRRSALEDDEEARRRTGGRREGGGGRSGALAAPWPRPLASRLAGSSGSERLSSSRERDETRARRPPGSRSSRGLAAFSSPTAWAEHLHARAPCAAVSRRTRPRSTRPQPRSGSSLGPLPSPPALCPPTSPSTRSPLGQVGVTLHPPSSPKKHPPPPPTPKRATAANAVPALLLAPPPPPPRRHQLAPSSPLRRDRDSPPLPACLTARGDHARRRGGRVRAGARAPVG